MINYYLSLFPSYTRDKPRFIALAEAMLRQAADLIALVQSLASGFSFAHAAGLQLDALGESIGIPRQSGWDDETYRSILLKKLKLWTWDGTNETVSDFLSAEETLKDNGNNSITVSSAAALPLSPAELMPVPIGVKTIGGNA